jgi:hypothetical protein
LTLIYTCGLCHWANVIILNEFWKWQMAHLLELESKIQFPLKFSFWIFIDFQWEKLFKIQPLSHRWSFKIRISCHATLFVEDFPLIGYQECTSTSLEKLILILLKVQWQNYSKFNTFCNICVNHSKTPWCTPSHWGLSNDTKIKWGSVVFGEISKC